MVDCIDMGGSVLRFPKLMALLDFDVCPFIVDHVSSVIVEFCVFIPHIDTNLIICTKF